MPNTLFRIESEKPTTRYSPKLGAIGQATTNIPDREHPSTTADHSRDSPFISPTIYQFFDSADYENYL